MYFEMNRHVSLPSIDNRQKAGVSKNNNTYIGEICCICVMHYMELLEINTLKIRMTILFWKKSRQELDLLET